MNRYANPVRILQGPGCVQALPQVLAEAAAPEARVLLLVWNSELCSLPVFAQLLARGENACRACCFQASNPTVDQLLAAYRETRDFAPQVVVAVGGGSTLDVGKSLCCLYGRELADGDDLRRLIAGGDYGTPAVRWIGIPTTAGTGSEVTCWATIWDPDQEAKRSVECRENYAWAALVDPDLAAGMPLQLSVSSALDALAHAVESYWARGTNCVSRALALEAIRTILGQLEDLIAGVPAAHDAMARGSLLAGLAFSNTKTTACHSISYPLTMHYGIPHGTAVSLLLAPVLRLNAPAVAEVSALLDALGVRDAGELADRVRGYLERAGIPTSLQAWGARRADLPHLAQRSLTKGRADNNPVEIRPETALSLLEDIYTTDHMEQKGA